MYQSSVSVKYVLLLPDKLLSIVRGPIYPLLQESVENSTANTTNSQTDVVDHLCPIVILVLCSSLIFFFLFVRQRLFGLSYKLIYFGDTSLFLRLSPVRHVIKRKDEKKKKKKSGVIFYYDEQRGTILFDRTGETRAQRLFYFMGLPTIILGPICSPATNNLFIIILLSYTLAYFIGISCYYSNLFIFKQIYIFLNLL